MLQLEDARQIEGMDVTDPEGNRIGTVDTVYLDNETDEPEFALVNTGLFGTRSSFVPLAQAQLEDDHLRVPHSKDEVKDAPNIEADDELSPDEEARIYEYYGLSYGTPSADLGTEPTQGAGLGQRGPESAVDERGPVGHDTSGPQTDDAMTRSEEELHVGTRQRETGRARLRKIVETEPVRERVETREESARVEREPITEANIDEATSGPEISEAEHEVTLHAEEPVVSKQAVPKERVRLTKDEHVEEHEIADEVRKERIEADEDERP